ncbi:hypothetical protein SORBI_3002G183000 [Sorghum bicolor]|uniref:Uncharacterized protein n=1 Tax=Sorghum bicolor TaxID=4558 RepID=A0A1W0W4R7_SORBI|nr:hypothetical protein SORBI_3002G183000 [Sorghum bicolor]OQU89404.1 hypothetical protein SORBI_3002G183000 [Sorghum bicolor]OQU89405.1 hypothetical protein SORBI_3002G183000 [Sorghum bicolor]OQU89406.1 hypothetical protein SORBI_3002G183000 [Sorghum bicolor]OQU89410.1 hypothetical protein SORBI_3002G183000 [Sorghum bicolor]
MNSVNHGDLPCLLSTNGIVMEITERLKQHGAIFNVALSPPNFIIHLTTLELQLQILSCKTFSGPDFLLDILPWCLEHGSFDLPWIIKSSDQDRTPHHPDTESSISISSDDEQGWESDRSMNIPDTDA